MNVFMIGGTGLLGSQAAKELIERGHTVKTLALPGVPTGAKLPEDMGIYFGNYNEMSDDRLREMMQDCDGFVFAAGVDERVEGKRPVYDMFYKHNNLPLTRLLPIAKEVGIKHVVILGSYFSFFAKIWPEHEMGRWHPYIQSRLDQEKLALSFADEDFHVAVLELPYIFGTQPGRKPVWVFLVEMLQKMPGRTLYPDGGTAMVTVRQVGQAIAGALEKNRGGTTYPIGWFNLSWREMLGIFHKAMGMPDRKITTLPTWLFQAGMVSRKRKLEARGYEGGLDLVKFAPVMASQTYIDKALASERLGVTDDDIAAAITDSVKLSLDAISGRQGLVEMTAD
ncbi:MAG TPA: NAD-dependent epimerase/dehydratase family protein [Tissierellia bacterium]|nr:NAD-dependent epimerase/dehydratase family protein [Tissierellia bacterium]